ncbi:MAG TPA: glycosyl transferase [Alphaproteobacteria bacterium]|nr:glycosyl transferase [Alphaproteobacteria bacterium]
MSKIAVLVPCRNEAVTIGDVVKQAQAALPDAGIYVYDNKSTDGSAEIARKAGAVVQNVSERGKGGVMRRMFQDIDADIYIMTDGDTTYDIARAPDLIRELTGKHLQMVVGKRKHSDAAAYRAGHCFGNKALTGLVRLLFHAQTHDMMSGFRVFTKEFAKSFPAKSNGFELETEMTIFAAKNNLPVGEIETDYFARPRGSVSKLSTYKDGAKILLMIIRLFLH